VSVWRRLRSSWFSYARWIGLFAGALLLGGSTTATGQSWKTSAVASFDEAWKTINDTFYDPSFGGLDWAAVRDELRPRVERAATPDAARLVLLDMLGRLKRSHFGLLSSTSSEALPGPAFVPVEIRIAGNGVVITRVNGSAAAEAGLAPGQTLLSVDGQPVGDFRKGTDALERRAAALEIWRRVNRALHGWDGSTSSLRVRDVSGAERTVVARRTMGDGEMTTVGNLPPLRVQFDAHEMATPAGRRIGVISFSVWLTILNERIAGAVDRFRQHDGIVIDLRGNPGGLAAMMDGVAGHFVGEPVKLGTMRTRLVPLTFTVNPRIVTTDGRRVDVYRGPLAILVDELTGSTSETFVGSLQGLRRARVFGRQTMGQALPALTKQLATGDVLIYAIGDYTTSSGRSLEGEGVIPDVSISLSTAALAAGRDQAMDAALRWVDGAGRNAVESRRN
jgi:carboxyl-terminal processing protease